MFMIMSFSIISSIIGMIMIIALNFISKKSTHDREKMSPFECGFDPKSLARLPFSLQFFLIAIIFVIFDVELTLFLPMIIISKTSNLISITISMILFLIILIFGLFHEQSQGSLNWVK
uniref:NADH-ubiquinone oxidoreductase chain 3 n=1 Tax=Scolytinae sp. BMNH 1039996 TaxID=1903774 RepID=A0A343A508_9CUCU|nr:NADH dehydrogenase subunit 3 [Scolytinae sp. BMNH 1039996]